MNTFEETGAVGIVILDFLWWYYSVWVGESVRVSVSVSVHMSVCLCVGVWGVCMCMSLCVYLYVCMGVCVL